MKQRQPWEANRGHKEGDRENIEGDGIFVTVNRS